MKQSFIHKLTVFSTLMLLACAPAHADDETPLSKEMDELSSTLKSLRKAEGWEAKAEIARKAQEYCLAGLKYLPRQFKEMPEGKEKAKATADYKRLTADAYSAICQLEIAFLNEDEDAVDEALSLIKEVKKSGHKKYDDS